MQLVLAQLKSQVDAVRWLPELLSSHHGGWSTCSPGAVSPGTGWLGSNRQETAAKGGRPEQKLLPFSPVLEVLSLLFSLPVLILSGGAPLEESVGELLGRFELLHTSYCKQWNLSC